MELRLAGAKVLAASVAMTLLVRLLVSLEPVLKDALPPRSLILVISCCDCCREHSRYRLVGYAHNDTASGPHMVELVVVRELLVSNLAVVFFAGHDVARGAANAIFWLPCQNVCRSPVLEAETGITSSTQSSGGGGSDGRRTN